MKNIRPQFINLLGGPILTHANNNQLGRQLRIALNVRLYDPLRLPLRESLRHHIYQHVRVSR